MVKANAALAEGTGAAGDPAAGDPAAGDPAAGDPAAGDAAEHPGSAASMHKNATPRTGFFVSNGRRRRIARASHGCPRADLCQPAPGWP